MIKKLISTIVIIFCLSFVVLPIKTNASSSDNVVLMKAHATAYHLKGITRSGKETRYGICAMKEEYLGKTAIVYQRLPDGKIGKNIGTFEILDTGSGKGIQQGKVIDIWKPNLEECKEFMNLVYEDGCKGKVYIQIVDAEG